MGSRLRWSVEALGLAAVLAFVAGVAYLPHADSFSNPPGDGPGIWQLLRTYERWLLGQETDDYEYTLHVDENVHWVAMQATQRADSLRHHELFFGFPEDGLPLSLRGLVHERGFHVAVLTLQEMTGLPWLDVFRFLPALWLAVTALLLWAALRPWPGAMLAAALVALTPTSARFLGPGFLVPIGFGLAWSAAVLLLLPQAERGGRAAALQLLATAWAFFVHLIAGFAALLVLLSALPFVRERKGLALLAGAVLLPILWVGQVFASDIEAEVGKFGNLPLDATIFDQLGIPFLLLWAAGCAALALRPPRQASLPILAASVASIATFGFIVYALTTAQAVHAYAFYDRWHQPYAVFASVPLAYGLVEGSKTGMGALTRALERVRRRPSSASPRWRSWGAAWLAAAAFLLTAGPGLEAHVKEPYYHVLGDEDWTAYQWVAQNVGPEYEVFLSHPWKAPVLAALTGKQPYTWLNPGSPPVRGEEYVAYLSGRSGDGVWLVERDISLVVDPLQPSAPEFERVGPRTALLAWPYAQVLAEARGS